MKVKVLIGSAMAVGVLGIGVMAGSVTGSSSASAQTPAATSTPAVVQPAPAAPKAAAPKTDVKAAITQQQAEQAALAASPGNTVDHTSLRSDNGTPVYDVDFTNGGGVTVNGNTGAVIATETAGTDHPGGHGRMRGGADQAALAAKATVTQQDAEKAALAASPGNTVDHSRLGDDNGTIFWDVDFANGGGVTINANTGAVIATETAGTDHPNGPRHKGVAPTSQS